MAALDIGHGKIRKSGAANQTLFGRRWCLVGLTRNKSLCQTDFFDDTCVAVHSGFCFAHVRQEIRCDLFHGDASLCYSLVSYGGEKLLVQEKNRIAEILKM